MLPYSVLRENKAYMERKARNVMAHYYRNKDELQEKNRARYYTKRGLEVPPRKIREVVLNEN